MSEKQQPPSAARFLELFEEGKRFTEELLKENEKLRLVIAKLRDEKKELEQRAAPAADTPVLAQKTQVLERELVQLRAELAAMREQFTSIEEENREFAERYVRLERQNSDLISMYVATYRLHSTLDYAEVVKTVKEIVINLIGAEEFAVFLVDDPTRRVVLVAQEGVAGRVPEAVPLGEGIIGVTAAEGSLWVAPPETDLKTNSGVPIAAIPLKIGERVIGVIALYRLLLQKESFGSVDYELFELLGGHAATALYVANIYAVSERKRSTLEGFIDLLKSSARHGT